MFGFFILNFFILLTFFYFFFFFFQVGFKKYKQKHYIMIFFSTYKIGNKYF